MRESVTRLIRVIPAEEIFSQTVKRLGNKGRARLVSAAAVIPAARVVRAFIGPKASVAGSVGLLLNPTAQLLACRGYRWD